MFCNTNFNTNSQNWQVATHASNIFYEMYTCCTRKMDVVNENNKTSFNGLLFIVSKIPISE